MVDVTSAATATRAVPLWCQPFMNKPMEWWEANSHHYPKDWVAAEGGVDWTPDPNNSSTKITALLPGTVVGSGYFCKPYYYCGTSYQNCNGAQGYGVVTIRSANPYPNLVPGTMIDIYYQHIIIDPSIGLTCAGASGQQISVGQVIGSANGSFNIEVGVNVGTEWGRIWGGASPGPHVDPIPFLYQLISSGNVGSGSPIYGGVGSAGLALPGVVKQISTTIQTTSYQAQHMLDEIPGFLGICEALDIVEQFVPFTLPAKAKEDVGAVTGNVNYNIFGWDTGIVDPSKAVTATQSAVELPADSIQAILVFTITNVGAFLIRAMFVTAGLILFYALMINLVSSFIDVKDVAKTAETVAPLLL